MFKSVRVAVVGCGNMGRRHMGCMLSNQQLSLRATVDITEESAKSAYLQFKADYYTTDYDRVLKDPDVDAVFICTHHDTHVSLSIRAAKAGKHIFVEKPLALTVADCRRVEETVEASGVKAMVGFCERFSTLSQRARQLIPKPVMVWGRQIDHRWPDNSWAQHPLTGGGNVLSQGCHTFDLICWFNPEKPVRISAEGGTLTHTGTDVIDNVVSTILFKNGSIAAAIIGDCGPGGFPKLSYELMGGGKGAFIHNFYELWVNREKMDIKLRIYGGMSYATGGWDYGVPQELEAFAKYVLEGGSSPVPLKDGTRATLLVRKAFESIRTSKPQILNL